MDDEHREMTIRVALLSLERALPQHAAFLRRLLTGDPAANLEKARSCIHGQAFDLWAIARKWELDDQPDHEEAARCDELARPLFALAGEEPPKVDEP